MGAKTCTNAGTAQGKKASSQKRNYTGETKRREMV